MHTLLLLAPGRSRERRRTAWPVPQGCAPASHPHGLIKALNYFFGFHGRSDAMTANPELCLIAVPAWTAFGQSGVRTRPFSPTLPVMDSLALFLMASEKVSWAHGKETERMCSVTLFLFLQQKRTQQTPTYQY